MTRQKLTTYHIGSLIRAPTIPIMPHIEKRIKPPFGVTLPIETVCSGSITRSQNSETTHRFHGFKKSSNLGCGLILTRSLQNTTTNRGFSAVGFEAAIGGAV